MKSVTFIAGFNDHRSQPNVVTNACKYLLPFIFGKINRDVPLHSKTIASAYNHFVYDFFYLNHCLESLLKSCFTSCPIYSPGLYINTYLFCWDAIHFSLAGNQKPSQTHCAISFPFSIK